MKYLTGTICVFIYIDQLQKYCARWNKKQTNGEMK